MMPIPTMMAVARKVATIAMATFVPSSEEELSSVLLVLAWADDSVHGRQRSMNFNIYVKSDSKC